MSRVRWAGHEEARKASVSVVFAPGFCLCIGVIRWFMCIASQWVETLHEVIDLVCPLMVT